jgi:hypothetical protein
VVRETRAKKAKRPVRVARITELEGTAAAEFDIEPPTPAGEDEMQ